MTAFQRHPDGKSFRHTVANFVATFTVNAAIVLSIPRSSANDPVPIMLQRKERMIAGRWHVGEYVEGDRPSVVLVSLSAKESAATRKRIISNN